MTYDHHELDMAKPNPASTITIPEEGYILQPNKLYLGRTNEYTKTEGYIPMLEGRSSVGRLGVFIHVTAGFGDVGFAGYWTLEIFCVQPIRIYPNVEICQIYYHDIDGEYDTYQHGKYQNNTGIQPSMLWKDFQKITNNKKKVSELIEISRKGEQNEPNCNNRYTGNSHWKCTR